MTRDPVKRLVAGERLGADEARELLLSPDGRSRVAESDASALFALLGSLPPTDGVPPMPRLAGVAVARRGRLVKSAVAAAAGLVACAALVVAVQVPATDAGLERAGSFRPPAHRAPVSEVVRRIDSPTAQVVTLVPPSADGPTVTLIIDEEIDL